MKMKYTFSPEDCEQIKKARKSNRDKQIEKRLQVLEMRCDGITQSEIAKASGFHRSYVSSLIRKYFEEGLTSIATKHYTGNHRNMSFTEEEALLAPFKAQAEAGKLVEISEIEEAYRNAVGHSIGTSQIYYVLHRHGWRKVMPRSRHPKKADEEVIATSKKLTRESKK